LIKVYYLLTKPGIIFSNVLTAIGGFFLAAKGHINLLLLFPMAFGLGLVIASACVFNNYIDQGIDAKMSRTKKRAFVTKTIHVIYALIYATLLGIIGFSLLIFYTNLLTTDIAFVGFFFYVVIYSIWKRRSEYGTIVGSVSGAVPPVVGYCAVTNHFDAAALLLFAILVFWQMPHFYAISLFRSEDYASAAIPILPLKKGVFQTKLQMIFYILAFIIAVALLSILHYTGYTYLVILLTLGSIWLSVGIKGFKIRDERKWARSMFFFSLVVIVVFSLLLSFNKVLF
jgi:protoheme IX farnesyltransferase